MSLTKEQLMEILRGQGTYPNEVREQVWKVWESFAKSVAPLADYRQDLIIDCMELMKCLGTSANFVFPAKVMQQLDDISRSLRPMAIVSLSTGQQVVMNKSFQQLLDTPGPQSVKRISHKGWKPEDYESLTIISGMSSDFTLSYESWWNPSQYGQMTGHIRIVELAPGAMFRVNTNLDARKLNPPPGVIMREEMFH